MTLYTVESVKRRESTWVAVDGGMSDNLMMLYGSPCAADVANGSAPTASRASAATSPASTASRATSSHGTCGCAIRAPATWW